MRNSNFTRFAVRFLGLHSETQKAVGEAPLAPTNEPSVQVERVERTDAGRPSGRRFGTLIHAILATVDLDADKNAIRVSAMVNGRLVGADEKEIAAAAVAVGAALRHPIMRRAAASTMTGALRRETPVSLKRADGTQIEGVIDLAFREATSEFTGWTVLDFKTDREFDQTASRYLFQVKLYSEAVSRATGAPSRGFLLVI